MLPCPQIFSLEQKYTHHVVDVHDVRSLQQFLHSERSGRHARLFSRPWAVRLFQPPLATLIYKCILVQKFHGDKNFLKKIAFAHVRLALKLKV